MKKMATRLLLFVLILAMAVSLSPINASAAEGVAVATSEFYAKQGETFTTTLHIPDGANIVDFDLTLNYDQDLVTLVDAEEHDDIKGTVVFNTETPGKIFINYTRTSKNVTEYLPLVNLTFSVDDNIGIGSYECLTIDPDAEYIAHRLNAEDIPEEVDFTCSFAKLNIYQMGDVNLSGKVDIGDATGIRRHLAGFTNSILTDFKLSLADTYYDKTVDIADASCLQRYLARFNVQFGDRVNITFYDVNGEKYAAKSVVYDGTLITIPSVPEEEGYSDGVWSLSATEYITPDFTNLTEDLSVYAFYSGGKTSAAVEYYKRMLTDKYYSGDLASGLSSDLGLWSTLNYQNGYYANFIWSSDSNYILNSTTGKFTKPTYPQDLTLTVKIISYDANDSIEAEDSISFDYKVPGEFVTPTKEDVADWIYHYFTDDIDGKYRVNYDVKLVAKLNNVILPTEGAAYDNFEIRLAWYQVVDGREVPISTIKRTTSTQTNDYVAVATFNGKPLDGDGKIYVDDVEVTAIQQIEIKNYIIQQIASNMDTLAKEGTVLWNNDTVYGTNVTWDSGSKEIAYVDGENTLHLEDDAISGSILPLTATVNYEVDGGDESFVLSYNLTVSCNNTYIKAPENMDPALYEAIKTELGVSGDLTSAALGSVKFVNLDLSDYPDITSLRGLSYCTNLRTLNISGLQITDGTMNQIATLSYLEAFIARGCELDNLSDGGTATLRNAVNLKMIDLTNNNFTSLDSVFAEGVKYGNLREVYLSNNKLTDINALQRAPMITYLSLANNGLTTEGAAAIKNYPYLSYLSLANNKIDSVENLTGLRYLKELRLHNNNLTEVQGLRALVNLEILYLGHNNIQDVGFLNTLTELKVFYVNDNRIADISELTALSKLELINVSNNEISSLSVLRNYTGTLTEIYAENNKLTDFSFINGATKLHILMLSGNDTTLAQDNMVTWLSGLKDMEVLTLSGIRLNDLSFLGSMEKLARLDVAGCGLAAFSGDKSNIEAIAGRYAKLRVLDISNNDMRGSEEELLKLRNCTLLTTLFADNVCQNLDIYTIAYSMPELRFISLENCGVKTMDWLSKYNNLVYVDLAGSNLTQVDLSGSLSKASVKTIEELYLDTNAENCTFADAYRLTDFNVRKLSLEGVNVGRVEYLPYMPFIEYLNIDKSGIKSLTGDDVEMAYLYAISRYPTISVIDVSNLETDLSPLEELPGLKTVYAVGAFDSAMFHENNMHALQRLYNSGVTCYLYDKQTEYTPVAQTEGTNILNLLPDVSCDIVIAADGVISDNNPTLAQEINDYAISWSVSNVTNYEIVDNKLAVKDYTGIDDETLILTAQIMVYPDQEPVTREFRINTDVLRLTPEYYEIQAIGYAPNLSREKVFTYEVNVIAKQTSQFTEPVKPVVDYIDYSYSAVAENGKEIPYVNVLAIGEDNNYRIAAEAQLGATVTITINIGHTTKSGENVDDIPQIVVPVTVASRTFTVTFVTNGGKVTDANGASVETYECIEDSLIFEHLTVARTGYIFKGWYTDSAFENQFSVDGSDAIMPSENITLYAKWEAHSFYLFFDANGGSVSEASKLILCDTEFGELPVPDRAGYKFEGWYTADGTHVTSTSTMATAEDVTVYAKWELVPYAVNWDNNVGYTVVVERTDSPNAGASIGQLTQGAIVYYGDTLRVTYAANTGYTINSNGVTEIVVNGNISANEIFATAKVNAYTATWKNGSGYSVIVNRIESPLAGAPNGSLSSGATIYYGDKLEIRYVKADYHKIVSSGPQAIVVTGNIDESDIYATAQLNDVSGWVLASEMPADAQIINNKWSYTETTTTESTATSMDGYYQIGSYWVQSGTGSQNYSTAFPGGFDQTHWIYTSFAKSALSGYENATNKREVSNSWTGYVYWHWMYDTNYANGTAKRAIFNKKGTGANGYGYKFFGAFTSSTGNYQNDTSYCNSLGIRNYIIPERTAWADCQGATRWFRFDYYTSYYTDYYKMFQYQKTENKESNTEVFATNTISNVQHWVQYRPK